MDERIIATTCLGLDKLKKHMEDIAGQWDGDLPDIQEERAQHALEVVEKIDALSRLLNEMPTL